MVYHKMLNIVPCVPWWLSGKDLACQYRRLEPNLWVRKIAWIRKWQPTPVFLPGKSHGQRSLTGYSPWSCKRVRHDLVTKQQPVSICEDDLIRK